MEDENPWVSQSSKVLGQFIRSQRQLARLSLRQLADRTAISNPYLSQLERGLHEPSLRVLKAIAEALDLSADVLLAQAGLLPADEGQPQPSSSPSTEAAIRMDRTLTDAQKAALLAVYRSYQEANVGPTESHRATRPAASPKGRGRRPSRPASGTPA
jgi:transcriptional regulator with XRE-family HTH domain